MSREHQNDGARPRAENHSRRRSISVGVSLFLVVVSIATLAVLADEWRKHAVKVDVQVTGTALLSVSEILALAAVPDTMTLADIDLMAVRQRIEKNPVVREALVRRNPPARLEIEIRERMPIALLLNLRAKDWLIDEDGFILPTVPDAAVQTVPVMTVGQGLGDALPGRQLRNPRVREALQVLRAARSLDPSFFNLFSEVAVDAGRDIVLYTLDAGVPVIFGRATDAERKFKAFRAYWENVAVQHALSELEYIDLRYSDQVVARWRNSTNIPAQPDTTAPTDLIID
ncbi:MAG: cell division protein FtsQ/DivIB [Ignavibacteria bacterium]|nr:cell division protein FtsQ/DivIB [Ignavibacteria bacterium]